MKVQRTSRNFDLIEQPQYPSGIPNRLVQQSSAVGDYHDALDRPGSSFLWIGEHHHLNREEVAELVTHLQAWLATGRLEVTP